ncbi:hypothetical protein BKA69DRAFT_1035523 [Paraphysoderma sedebokerense]|nr:hypothetical protein BKA69DRAFT_1035523 [Paraphysoderma sedebokerense]
MHLAFPLWHLHSLSCKKYTSLTTQHLYHKAIMSVNLSDLDKLVDPSGSPDNVAGLFIQLAATSIAGIGATMFFSMMRVKRKTVYMPNAVYQSKVARATVPALKDVKIPKQLPEIPQTFFGWSKIIYDTPFEMMLESIGLDAVIFIKVLAMCVKIFGILMVLGSVALIPTNILGGNAYFRSGAPPSAKQADLGSISIKNNFVGMTPYLWVHITFIYVMSAVTMYFLYDLYREYVDLRQKYYFRDPLYLHSVHSKSLLVSGIPSNKRSDNGLAQEMSESGVTHFRNVNMVTKVDKLEELVLKREKQVFALEKLIQGHFKETLKQMPSWEEQIGSSSGTLPTSNMPNLQLPSEAHQMINEIKDLENQIHKLRSAMTYHPLFAGFVTFGSAADSHGVAQALRGKTKNGCEVELAPEPVDLIWSSLESDETMINRRKKITKLIVLAIVIGWAIPIIILTPFTQLNFLAQHLAFVRSFIATYPKLAAAVESILVPLLFNLFMMFLPTIFRLLSKNTGVKSQTQLTSKTFRYLYAFYAVGFWLFFTVASVFLSIITRTTLDDVKGNLTDANRLRDSVLKNINRLASTVVDKGAFWINYAVLNGAGSIPVDLARAVPLIIAFIKTTFFTLTPRDQLNITTPPPFDYDIVYSTIIFMSFIGLVYATLHPIILVFVFLYCVVAYMVYKYQILFVYATKIESGGTLYPTIFSRFCVTLLVSQITFVVYILSIQQYLRAIAIAPLFVATIVFMKLVPKKLKSTSEFLSKEYGPIDDSHYGNIDQSALRAAQRERYDHPSVSGDLISPMVDPRLEHLVAEYFPELKFGRKGSNLSLKDSFNMGSFKTDHSSSGSLPYQPTGRTQMYANPNGSSSSLNSQPAYAVQSSNPAMTSLPPQAYQQGVASSPRSHPAHNMAQVQAIVPQSIPQQQYPSQMIQQSHLPPNPQVPTHASPLRHGHPQNNQGIPPTQVPQGQTNTGRQFQSLPQQSRRQQYQQQPRQNSYH